MLNKQAEKKVNVVKYSRVFRGANTYSVNLAKELYLKKLFI